ncbi:MAG: retroviral-like aspartic protease family protein [bacterium]
MGEVKVPIDVRALSSNGAPAGRFVAIVDTGATLPILPGSRLKALGIVPSGRVRVLLANGEVMEREMGEARVTVEGATTPCRVLFGADQDEPLLGVTVLELLGLAVDPVQGRLIPSPYKLF